MLKVLFFGSFQKYSNQVFEKLLERKDLFEVVGVVTTPPRPAGRDRQLTPTPTQTLAEDQQLPVFPLENLDEDALASLKSLTGRPDFLIVAGYGKLIPGFWLKFPKIAPVNAHMSYLPHYPGRFPSEWCILMGEETTGVTLIRMSPEFDKGEIYTQEKITITPTDTRESLYHRLYDLGGSMSETFLALIARGEVKSQPQTRLKPPKYARQITREDGYVPVPALRSALSGGAFEKTLWTPLVSEVADFRKLRSVIAAVMVDRMLRALDPWPGVWTLLPTDKRLKILKGHLAGENSGLVIDSVQLEGKKPQAYQGDLL